MNEQELLQQHKFKELQAMRENKIGMFPQELFHILNQYNYGGLPLGVKIFTPEITAGKCYESASFLSLGLSDYIQHWGTVEYLRIGRDESKADHSFVESNGHIFDTTTGYLYNKKTYMELEKPNIRKSATKAERDAEVPAVKDFLGEQDLEMTKWAATMFLPGYENIIANSTHPVTRYHKPMLLQHLKEFRQKIKFDELKREMQAEMELAKRNPDALDKKLGIVRDEYGYELSRNGVPNPYYIKPDQKKFIDPTDPKALEKIMDLC